LKENPCYHDVFDLQVSRSPDAVAIICGDEQLTYRELIYRVNQLALHLQKLGVQPNGLVGICVERSIDMVVGILGILKSGGAYVPLDPAYPQERLTFIQSDSNMQIVVTQPKLLEMFSGKVQHTLCVGDVLAAATTQQQPEANLKRQVSERDLAYVIYTSGSTGKPKGVMITHENLCHFVRIACEALDVTAGDIYLQTASISYALSVRQLMIPLAYGAALVIADSEQIRDPLMLFALIKQEQISLMDMVPSFWRTCTQRLLLLSKDERRDLLDNRLRRIVSIGEALLSDIPRDWKFKLGHDARLVNIFGQTETTGVVAAYPIPIVDGNEIETVPIGWSVPDTALYILDADLQPVADGEIGELCISNPCIASGYLNRPELTEKKFILNPFDATGGSRLYRTGDIARHRADGVIEFMGRSDFQIKIRGQRLELGEVEAVLSECSFVQACVVVAQGEHPDDKHLAAYIIPVHGQQPAVADIRQYMKQRIPDYMVPSVFIFLDVFPLTPNGKLDRLILADPDFARLNYRKAEGILPDEAGPGDDLTAGGSPLEGTLADMWKQVLKIEQVGVHDNFFDLGGHSLSAANLLAMIETTLGARLPVSIFFKGPTIAELVRAISGSDKADTVPKGSESLIPIHVGDRSRPPFFWLHGSDFAYIKPYLDPSQPFYCIMPSGLNDGEDVLEDEGEIAEHHLRAILAQQPTGPYLLGGYCNGGKNAIAVALRLIERGHDVRLLALVDVPVPDQRHIQELNRPMLERFMERLKRGRFLDVAYEKFKERMNYMANSLAKNTYLLRFTEITQAHDRTFKFYVMPRPFPGALSLFTCDEQYANAGDELDERWSKLTTQGIRQYIIPGNHTTMVRKPNIQVLGEKLKQAITDSQN